MKDIEIEKMFFFPNPPAMYKETEVTIPEFSKYCKAWEWNGLRIMASGGDFDGKQWLHVSFSRKSKMPTYQEMQLVKKDFIGNRKAIFVLPKEENYVNIHKYCLHLWVCEEDNIIPDFDMGLGTI